jgi:hypothetical protein
MTVKRSAKVIELPAGLQCAEPVPVEMELEEDDVVKLLLPGVNLVGMDLVALPKVTVACSRSASSAIFAFSPASIRRLVFFVIVRSVYQTERPFSNLTHGPKNRSTSVEGLLQFLELGGLLFC